MTCNWSSRKCHDMENFLHHFITICPFNQDLYMNICRQNNKRKLMYVYKEGPLSLRVISATVCIMKFSSHSRMIYLSIYDYITVLEGITSKYLWHFHWICCGLPSREIFTTWHRFPTFKAPFELRSRFLVKVESCSQICSIPLSQHPLVAVPV